MLNKQVDYKLFFSVFGLIVFGMIMISSVSVYGSFKVTSTLVARGVIDEPYNYFYVIRNISQIIFSLFVLLFLVKIPYTFFEKHATKIFGVSLFFMFLVLIIGAEYYGATGWLDIPGLPSIQPVEFLKFATVIYLAYFFKTNQSKLSLFKKGFIPFFGIMGVVFGLLALQPDFGSIMILGPIMVMMFFVAGARIKQLLIFFGLGIILFLSVYNLGKYDKTSPETIKETRTKLSYITDRIDNFITSEKELIKNQTINYQTEQAIIAIGSGGFSGLGFGKSIQKFGYLPEVQGDFIYSVFIEELGFLGGLFLLFMYGFIGYRGYFIALHSQDIFAKYVAFGITTRILVQTSINIGVNLNIVPLTGVTLPFISYGGSSLLSLILGLGVLLNISRYVDETQIVSGGKKRFERKKVHMYLE